ncbi:MAG TPA: D-alanyl-D-alanine carboxypeptidase/D-alanyl-D-alanine-endopeptidase [Anaeromyxobacter sp.]
MTLRPLRRILPTSLFLRAALASLALAASPVPAAESSRPADTGSRELDSALRAIVGAGPLASARTGVVVTDVETGQVLFARDPDVLLNPASNVKLVTSAAVLARLGPEFRFDTEIYVDAASGGDRARALYVRGKGDPTLVTERLWAIAGDLVHLGIRHVGDVVVDESYFDGERVGPGFDQESGDRSYLAPAGAASLNWNTVAVHVAPGDRRGGKARVELEPASDLFEVDVRATTVAGGGRRRIVVSSVRAGARQRIVVDGRIPMGSRMQTVWRRIDDPALYLGHTLRRLMELRGARFAGKVRAGAVPQGARLVHVAQSESLGEVVRRLNKTSNNFMAEQLLKTLGAEAKGTPGTWPKGVEAVEEFLDDAGIARGAYVMRNGSGLNDTNRFSPRQLATLLRSMWARFPLQAEYLASLPVAGRDGTIRWRMEGSEAEGRLRAKTGTLENVTSLSGYVENAAHRTLAFSILVNDFPGRAGGAVRAVDALGAALAASGGPPGSLGPAVALAKAAPPAEAAPAADLAAKLRTYYAMGRTADRRNMPFFRNALRSERDPQLRLVLGECLYLSDPDSETARRSFIDAIPADPQALARVFAAAGAAAEGADLPVLASLGDLAAEGTTDALPRLVELAPASASDGALARAYADVLSDEAASLPGDVVQALAAASPAAQEAAVGALAAGIVRSDEREHPFPGALRALAERKDDGAAFARALQQRLATAISAANANRGAATIVPASGSLPPRAP